MSTRKPAITGKGWWVIERDDLTAVVGSAAGEAVVEFDIAGAAWLCSEHGAFAMLRKVGSTVSTCDHIMAATRDLPTGIALRISAALAPVRPGSGGSSLSTRHGGAVAGEAANKAATAAVHERSAEARAERHRRHDQVNREITSYQWGAKLTPEQVEQRLVQQRGRKKIEGLAPLRKR